MVGMENNIDYVNLHYCPVYKKMIDIGLCYESLMCLSGMFKISSVPELREVENIDVARQQCRKCLYSKL